MNEESDENRDEILSQLDEQVEQKNLVSQRSATPGRSRSNPQRIVLFRVTKTNFKNRLLI